MDLVEIALGGMYWIGLAQDKSKWNALVNEVSNLRVASNAGKLSNGYTTGGLSSDTQPRRIGLFATKTGAEYSPFFMACFLFGTINSETRGLAMSTMLCVVMLWDSVDRGADHRTRNRGEVD
jgi:hypothetical protein